MCEKNIFVQKLFFVVKYFISIFFFCKNCNPLKKVTPLFPSNPPLKIEILSSPLPPFWKFGRRLNPLAERGGRCTLWVYWGLTCNVVFYRYSYLISHKHTQTHTNIQRHTVHSWASRLTHPYKYVPTVIWS